MQDDLQNNYKKLIKMMQTKSHLTDLAIHHMGF